MKTVPHISLLLAAAFLISLGSCVNEVKNVEEGPPVDTNYLHKFTQVSVYFSASASTSSTHDGKIIFNYTLPITWSARKYNGKSSASVTGEISSNGNKIISSAWEYGSKSWSATGSHGFDVYYLLRYLEVESIQKNSGNDTLVFSESGEKLFNAIKFLTDKSYTEQVTWINDNTQPTPPHLKPDIYKTPEPVIVIKFFK